MRRAHALRLLVLHPIILPGHYRRILPLPLVRPTQLLHEVPLIDMHSEVRGTLCKLLETVQLNHEHSSSRYLRDGGGTRSAERGRVGCKNKCTYDLGADDRVEHGRKDSPDALEYPWRVMNEQDVERLRKVRL